MNIIETTEIFKQFLKETDNKQEIKIYKDFIAILDNLKSRNLTEEQLLLIEEKIKVLNLKSNPKNKKKFFSQKLNIFKQFLKDKFSLITEGYYTVLSISLGLCFGGAIGVFMGIIGIALGSTIGLIVGLIIGRYNDIEAENKNRVLKTEPLWP